VVFGPDGALYFSEPSLSRVRRVGPDGVIRTFAGSSNAQNAGDGGFATLAAVSSPFGLAFGKDGSLYIAQAPTSVDFPLFRIRRVATSGVITSAVGTGVWIGNSNAGDGRAMVGRPSGADRAGAGDHRRCRRQPAARGQWAHSQGDGVPAGVWGGADGDCIGDGSELYVFSAAGRLLVTLNAATRDTIYRFSYNNNRQLASITNANGLITTVERNSAGAVTALVGPNGQRTNVTLDANGHIASVVGPDNGLVGFTLDTNGMLARVVSPLGDTLMHYQYDSSGRVVGMINELGGATGFASAGGRRGSYPILVVPRFRCG